MLWACLRGGRCLLPFAGAAQAWALAGPRGTTLGILQMLGMAFLCWHLQRDARSGDTLGHTSTSAFWSGARTGWWFAGGWLVACFWWLYISMHDFGGMPAWMAVLAILALAGALGLYYAAACGVWVHMMRRGSGGSFWRASLSFAGLWTLAELARGQWFTGFPWGAVGYAHVDGPIGAYAPWVGVYGMGAVAAGLSMAWVLLVEERRQLKIRPHVPRVLGLLVILAGPSLWATWAGGWTSSTGQGQVRLLQGNIAQDEKFIPGRGIDVALQWYAQQLQENSASLVVAPETAIPLLPSRLPEDYWQQLIQRYARTPDQLALVGIPLGTEQDGFSNAVVSLSSSSGYRYDKHHLVPFGEFIPPLFQWFLQLMHIPLGSFERGALAQDSLTWQGQRLGPNICYEDLFGEELAMRFVRSPLAGPDTSPTVLVNVSNIGWFGNTIAIDQHLNISRLRSLELERPMLRATNTGATAIIDHRGQVQGLLPRFTRGALDGIYEGRQGLTPYAWWAGHAGLKPLWWVCLGLVAWGWGFRRRG